jgi:hypothetical protein
MIGLEGQEQQEIQDIPHQAREHTLIHLIRDILGAVELITTETQGKQVACLFLYA